MKRSKKTKSCLLDRIHIIWTGDISFGQWGYIFRTGGDISFGQGGYIIWTGLDKCSISSD
jgi:hypothetical protein